jgi:DNA-directed RNA polymerase subunit beta'
MGDMARSGARGNMVQLMKTVGSPVGASDEYDVIQPWLVSKSYAEGLKPSEWWVTMREARMNAAKSTLEVSEPGDISKILINNSAHQIITEADCGTDNGLSFDIDNPEILDRYTAKAVGSFPANTLITPRVVTTLKTKKIKTLIARSPMTCEAQEGLCQHCVGLNSTGKLNKLGENIGIRASQALGEPLTQMALNAKHGVRIAGENVELSGLEGFRTIIEAPESFRNKAALAPITGKITAINAAPQGGHFIEMDKEKIYAGHGLALFVKPGDTVDAGDVLSAGIPKPNEVVAYKGLGAGRDYVVKQLSGIYKNAGVDVDRRHLEVLVKSTLNHMQIDEISDEDSATHGLVRGDVINYNRFKNIIGDDTTKTALANAEGKFLGESLLHHLASTRINKEMIEEFKQAGVTHVRTAMNSPMVHPIMEPASRNPLLNPDWLVRLGHRYLKQSILEGAHTAQSSDLHGTHPLPSMIMGSEFGEAENGRY